MRLMLATASAILLLATTVSACDDGMGNAQSVPMSCSGLRALTHYQYRLDMQLLPPTENDPDRLPKDPRQGLIRAIDRDLPYFTVNGRVVFPDRIMENFSYANGQVETRSIEGRYWARTAEDWVEEARPAGDLPTAESVCNFVQPLISDVRTSDRPDATYAFESETQHYHLNLSNGDALEPLLGENAFGDYTIDVWLAKDGRWPAHIVIQSNNGEPDSEREYRVALEVRDPNDISLRVDQP